MFACLPDIISNFGLTCTDTSERRNTLRFVSAAQARRRPPLRDSSFTSKSRLFDGGTNGWGNGTGFRTHNRKTRLSVERSRPEMDAPRCKRRGREWRVRRRDSSFTSKSGLFAARDGGRGECPSLCFRRASATEASAAGFLLYVKKRAFCRQGRRTGGVARGFVPTIERNVFRLKGAVPK